MKEQLYELMSYVISLSSLLYRLYKENGNNSSQFIVYKAQISRILILKKEIDWFA